MAARAGTATIMEAVETAEEAEMLRLLGIDYGQGYFFSEPLPGIQLAHALTSRFAPPSQNDSLGASASAR